MNQRHLAGLIGCLLVAPAAFATDGADLTLYRSDSAALFAAQGDGSVGEGYAVAHERRDIALKNGVQDIIIGGLPDYLDAEALALRFPAGKADILSQRLLLAQGANAALTGLVGQDIVVLGPNGEALAQGKLVRAGRELVVRTANGDTTMVRDYAAVRAAGEHAVAGSSLQLRVDAHAAGTSTASLSYPTSGLGWRAAYVGTLADGNRCTMRFEARASVANRSGRDWNETRLKLVAGEPNMAKPQAMAAPAPMMFKANMRADAPPPMPAQATLGDYRTYTLPNPVNLPDGSVSQLPLYATRDVGCERSAVYEPSAGGWTPPRPMLESSFDNGTQETVSSQLRFKAFDTLPAGYLRVLTTDRDGNAELLGEARIEDTPKGSDADVTLGTALDLRGKRERTSFEVNKSAANTLDEAFRITLTNAGDSVRTITVREHPRRWNHWTVTSSSHKPTQQTPDLLEFKVDVPANGSATLDYAVRYSWTAKDINP